MRELREVMQDIAPREARNLLRATVHGVAGVARDRIRARAPVDTGDLKKSIKVVRRRGAPNAPRSDVVADRKTGFHWLFLEFGTVKAPARPFITPEVEALRPQLPGIYEEQFIRKYEAAVARKAKRAARR